jgi:hypothetical protein
VVEGANATTVAVLCASLAADESPFPSFPRVDSPPEQPTGRTQLTVSAVAASSQAERTRTFGLLVGQGLDTKRIVS